jgi:hypothetical protein
VGEVLVDSIVLVVGLVGILLRTALVVGRPRNRSILEKEHLHISKTDWLRRALRITLLSVGLLSTAAVVSLVRHDGSSTSVNVSQFASRV